MNKKFSSLFLPIFILIVYIVLITFQPSLQLWPKNIVWFVDRQRLLELLLLSLVLIDSSLIILTNKRTFSIPKSMQWALVLLAIFSSFSALLAYSTRHAVVEISAFIGLGYLSLFVSRWYQEDALKCIQFLTYILWGSVVLYMLSFYTGYLTATIVKKVLTWPQPFTGFTNIRNFNQYQLWTLGFVTLPLLLFKLKKSTRFMMHTVLIAWWVLLFYSASRGILIACIGAILLTACYYRKMAWHFIKMQVMHLTLGFVGFQLLFKKIPQTNDSALITSSLIRDTTYDRLELWDRAILIIQSSPLFGAGPMHFAWYNQTNGHPHNSILQLASEWGLPAAIIILTIGGYGLYCWMRCFNQNSLKKSTNLNQSLAVILLFTISASAAYSLVDGVIVTPISQVLMFTTVGILLGQYIAVKKIGHMQKSRVRPLLAVAMLALMFWSNYPEVRQGLSGDAKGFSMGHKALGPRFWK